MSLSFDEAAGMIVAVSRRLADQGWAPAGAGNYSCRLAGGGVAITVSGAHKAELQTGDVMALDAHGAPLDGRRPSAETELHLLLYRRFPQVEAVLHTHSIPVVALSRRRAAATCLRLAGYELLKAFPGVETHDCEVELPLFDNSQDMPALAAAVDAALAERPAPAFLIRDHGLYGWGRTMNEALRVVEAAETLVACELALARPEEEA